MPQCPNCEAALAEGSARCPRCGTTIADWRDLLRGAWNGAFRHAWKAALAFPLIYLVAVIVASGSSLHAYVGARLVAALLLLGALGFLAGLTSIASMAAARRLLLGAGRADPWAWTDLALIILIVSFAIWVSLVAVAGLRA